MLKSCDYSIGDGLQKCNSEMCMYRWVMVKSCVTIRG